MSSPVTEEDIFKIWEYGCSSGAGSDPVFAKEYIDFVSRFIREHDIRSIVDVGCGDFQVGSCIDYGSAKLTAVDASTTWIDRHQTKYVSDDRFTFLRKDIRSFDCSGFDLALVKDVLQHWPSVDILEWISSSKARFTLVTNDVGGGVVNSDISYDPSGGQRSVCVRGLDLNAEPVCVGGSHVLTFNGKKTLLLERK